MTLRLLLSVILLTGMVFCQPYPDQYFTYERENLVKHISSVNGMQAGSDGKSIVLAEGALNGSVTFEPDSSQYPFDLALPSWNGHVSNDYSGFRVLIRFYKNGWSPWLTAGYWKNNLWSDYGPVSYSGGKIDVDIADLYSFHNKWQFQVEMTRSAVTYASPEIYKLNIMLSDKQLTLLSDPSVLVKDNPEAIFIPTQFISQFSINPTGQAMNHHSPASICMAIRSFNIAVNADDFTAASYDPYWKMHGVWPRGVQNAAEYKLTGTVTRYRSWSEARKVLEAGGRIVMSVGPPLYDAHQMMLAGFDTSGNPIVHDPEVANGYNYKFNKSQLTYSWFGKGGIALTFFRDTLATAVEKEENIAVPAGELLICSYPNPFNQQATIWVSAAKPEYTRITVYDITGREIETLCDGVINAGVSTFRWNAADLPSGNYFIQAVSGSHKKTVKTLLLK